MSAAYRAALIRDLTDIVTNDQFSMAERHAAMVERDTLRNTTETTYETTTALHVVNGDQVLIGGAYRTVGAAHYAGPIDGSGTTTLEILGRAAWSGAASTPIRRVVRV